MAGTSSGGSWNETDDIVGSASRNYYNPSRIFDLVGFRCARSLSPNAVNTAISQTQISDKDGMAMLYIPAGDFSMGSNNGEADEKPVHKVNLDAYWIDSTKVTNAMYAKCVSAGVCQEPSNKNSNTHSNYYGNSQFDNYPVIYVDWNMAKTYCKWRGDRLPTEAEWEKAARGTDGRTYPWGNDAPNKDLLNYRGAINDTTKVGSYESGKSPYGLYDMAGNGWEWVSDWYGSTYYQTSPSSNPLGPDTGAFRALRGGSWYYYVNYARSAYRSYFAPSFTNYYVGFRCASSQP